MIEKELIMKVHMKSSFLIITHFLFLTRTHRLATEIYKVDNDLSAEYFENLFDFKDRYTAPIFLSLFIYLFIFHQL